MILFQCLGILSLLIEIDGHAFDQQLVLLTGTLLFNDQLLQLDCNLVLEILVLHRGFGFIKFHQEGFVEKLLSRGQKPLYLDQLKV